MNKNVKTVLKLLIQLVIIFLFLQVGNLFSHLLKRFILIPGSLLGMILLSLTLMFDLIKIKHIDHVSSLMLKNMGLLFVPFGVTILEQIDLVKEIWLPLLFICLISTLLVMIASGLTTQGLMKWQAKRRAK